MKPLLGWCSGIAGRRPRFAPVVLGVMAVAGLAQPAAAQNGGVEAELVDPNAPDTTPVAPPPRTQPEADADGLAFDVSSIELMYDTEHPRLPSIEELSAEVSFELSRVGSEWIEPVEGIPTQRLRLADLNDGVERVLYASAIERIAIAVVEAMERRNIVGVFVAPDYEGYQDRGDLSGGISIFNGGEDERPDGDTRVRLLIFVATVADIRTQAFGERVGTEDRINAHKHRRILRDSPIRPHAEGEPEGDRADVLNRADLDRYAFLLSRHPGRRVDIAVGPATDGGRVVLDYLVQESRPWQFYAQLSNTGTEATQEWRQRFGFVHNQFTGRDDEFVFEYSTAGFDSAHTIITTYETPIFRNRRWRLGINGSWSEYTASEVGAANQDFSGESYGIGANLYYNFFQHNTLFVDAYAGVQFDDVEVSNDTFGTTGSEEILTGRVGFRAERIKETSTILGDVGFRFVLNNPSVGNLEQLGRLNPDEDFFFLTWDTTFGFYLEPLLNRRGWEDPTTPASSTLAHELELRFRGQTAFNNRLVPNFQNVSGGLYSVRGYEESAAAGDTAFVTSLEYRFHWPRTFAPRDPGANDRLFGRAFKWAPQQVYGRPDWDLVFRAFLDVGVMQNSARAAFETDETLVGAGVGLEFLLLRNLALRVDYGVALNETGSDTNGNLTEEGDDRFHFSFTALY